METILHSLGLCGEIHFSFISLLIEHNNVGIAINYFKNIIKI